MSDNVRCADCGFDMVERTERGVFRVCTGCGATVRLSTPRRKRSGGLKGIMSETLRICPAMLACDGATLHRSRTICKRCEVANEKRLRGERPLRGERCEEYTRTRKGMR